MSGQDPEPTNDLRDQDREPASQPTGAAGSDEETTDQDAGPASEPDD